jgi:hypothetical protein
LKNCWKRSVPKKSNGPQLLQRKPIQPKPVRPAHPKQTDRAGIWRRIPPIGKAAIGFAVTAFGLYTSYIATIKPRILIEPPSKSVQPQNPYHAPFVLSNDGFFSVYKLSVDCQPAVVAATGLVPASPATPWNVEAFVRHDVLTLDSLSATEHRPFVCDAFKQIKPINVKIDGVELQVTVTVSPLPFINWPCSKSVLFEADGDGTSTFQWHELRIGESPDFPKSSMLFGFVGNTMKAVIRRSPN